MPKPARSQPETAYPPYQPPQKLLVPCERCGMTVLRGIALPEGKIRWLDMSLTPVFGERHTCPPAVTMHDA